MEGERFCSPLTSPPVPLSLPQHLPPQAQKSVELSIQKLRLLKMSLENRLEEFPSLAEAVKDQEQNGETPPLLPKPTQLTGGCG